MSNHPPRSAALYAVSPGDGFMVVMGGNCALLEAEIFQRFKVLFFHAKVIFVNFAKKMNFKSSKVRPTNLWPNKTSSQNLRKIWFQGEQFNPSFFLFRPQQPAFFRFSAFFIRIKIRPPFSVFRLFLSNISMFDTSNCEFLRYFLKIELS